MSGGPQETTLLWWQKPAESESAKIDYEWTNTTGYSDGRFGAEADGPGGEGRTAAVSSARTYGAYTPTPLSAIVAPAPCPECGAAKWISGSTSECEHGHDMSALFVKTLEGKTYVIPYGSWECWGWYKERLAEVTSMPTTAFRLIFAGGQKEGGDRHSGLQKNSTCLMVVKDPAPTVKSSTKN